MKDAQKIWIILGVILVGLGVVYFFTMDSSTDRVSENTAQDTSIGVEENSVLLNLSSVEFVGNGTEPFWGFSASGTTLELREASDTGPMDLTTYAGVIMTQDGTSVNINGGLFNLDLILSPCSDGMSDIEYTYSSSFVAGSKSYTGCANIN